jgi:chromosome segregation ATPase
LTKEIETLNSNKQDKLKEGHSLSSPRLLSKKTSINFGSSSNLKSNFSNEEIEHLKIKIKSLEKSNKELSIAIENGKNNDQFNKEIENLKEQIKKITYQKIDFENKIQELNENITQLKDELINKDRLISRAQKKLKKPLKSLTDDLDEKLNTNSNKISIDDFQKNILQEDLEFHPIVALKKSILGIIYYFENQVEGYFNINI